MVEQLLEKKVADTISAVLAENGIADIQVVGSLQPSAVNELKAVEAESAHGLVIVKAAPRLYESPTIPTCEITIGVTANIRADIDYNGMTYLDVADKIMSVLQRWQRCYADTHIDFTIEGEFDCTGFQLDSGAFAFDRSDKVWQYTHSMTIFGVIQDTEETTNN